MSDFQVGDKVRTVVGEVTELNSEEGARVAFNSVYLRWFHPEALELVERPKPPEPKLGSIWTYRVGGGAKFVYTGDGFYAYRNYATKRLQLDELVEVTDESDAQ